MKQACGVKGESNDVADMFVRLWRGIYLCEEKLEETQKCEQLGNSNEPIDEDINDGIKD